MNQDLPSPEDLNLDHSSSEMEQELSRLQPRPVNFDAESILAAAELSSPAMSSKADGDVVLGSPSAYQSLPTIALSLMAGAIAGAFVMYLAVGRGTNGESRARSPEYRVSETSDGSQENPPHEEQRSPIASWSPNERLLETQSQLQSLHQPREIGEPILVAKSIYSPAPAPHHEPDQRDGETGGLGEGEEVTPEELDRSIGRNQLLRQLMGDSPRLNLQ